MKTDMTFILRLLPEWTQLIRCAVSSRSLLPALVAMAFPGLVASQEATKDRALTQGEKEVVARFEELRNSQRYAEAFPVAESWVRIAEAQHGPDHALIRPALEGLAMVSLITKRLPEAEELYRRALGIAERDVGTFHNDTLRILRRLTFLYEASGQKAELQDAKARVEVAASHDLKSVEAGHALLIQGRSYQRMGRSLEAEGLLRGALEAVEKEHGPNHAKGAAVLGELAFLYHLLKRYPEAESVAQQALEIAERTRGPGHQFTLNLMTTVSNIYPYMNRANESAAIREKQLTFRKANLREYEENLAILEAILGTTHSSYLFELGLAVSVSYYLSTDPVAQTAAYSRLLQTMDRILPLVEQKLGPNDFQVSRILEHTGSILLRQDRYAEAEPSLLRRLEILEEGARGIALRNHLADIFKFYYEWKEPDKAKAFCQRLLDRDRKTLESSLQTKTETDLLGSSTDLYSFAAPTLADGPLSADAILLYKGTVSDELLERRKKLMSATLAESDPRLAKFQALQLQLTASQIEGTLKGVNLDNIGVIERELRSIESDLVKDGSLAPPSLRSLRIRHSDVAAVLPANMAVIDFFQFSRYLGNQSWGPSYGCSIIRSDRPPAFEVCGRIESTDKAIFEFREMVARVASGEANDSALKTASQKLHGILMAKLLPHLEGIDTLVIAPDNALNLLPFPALMDGQGRFLAESFYVYHASSGRDLVPKVRPTEEPGPAVVLADPQFATAGESAASEAMVAVHRAFGAFDLSPLPGTRTEARGVYGILKGMPQAGENVMPLAGTQATESALRGVKSPRILHLATHGFFLSDLNTTGGSPGTVGDSVSHRDLSFGAALALSGADDTLRRWGRGEIPDTSTDGILFSGEVPSLNLEGTELVVLSACRTALGAASGEGVNGMRRAFVTAGARNVLMTLWDIADEPTAEFMTGFYRRFKESGNAPQSLATVQRESLVRLREKEGFSVAVYLAGPFVLSAQALK